MSGNKEFRVKLAKWVNNFTQNREERNIRDEEDVKNAIIDPLLEIFDWDVSNPEEVKKEASVGRKKADYALKIDGEVKVIIEAKALDKKLTDSKDTLSEYERQAINYAYNKGINWAILTNGEEWRFYNAYWKGEKLAFKLDIGEFPDEKNFERVSLLRKSKVKNNELDNYFEGRPQRQDVDEEVTQVLLDARADLTKSIMKYNKGYNEGELREGIQTILDRLLFMKICEDRDIIEYGQLRQTKKMVKGDPDNKTTLSDYLHVAFKRFRKVYDGGLFEEQIADELEMENSVLRDLIEKLYTYDFASIDVDILGRIYEDYLANILTKLDEGGLEWITDNSERKEHGQFYTPQYIVDYIVNNVGIDTDSLVLDPACGSGAFLIKAFDELKEKYIEEQDNDDEIEVNNGIASLTNYLGKETEKEINKEILKKKLHGVDLNEEAVEISRINLWLRSIQKDTELNKLDHNIRVGNSLISNEESDLEEYFDKSKEKKPFNWEEEFPEVFEENNGFDVIIGNPPYIRNTQLPKNEKDFYKNNYDTSFRQYDIYILFIEKTRELLCEGGKVGFIVSNKFMASSYGQKTRQFILNNFKIRQILDVSSIGVFEDASVYPCIIILEKCSNEKIRLENKITVVSEINSENTFEEKRFEEKNILQDNFKKTKNNRFLIDLTEEDLKLLEKLNSNTSLGEISNIMRGTPNTKLERCEEIKNMKTRVDKGVYIYKSLTSTDINKYSIQYSGDTIKHIDKKAGKERRKIYEEEKILLPRTVKKIKAAPDLDGYYIRDRIYLINPKTSDVIYQLAGILNSSIIQYIYERQFGSTHVSGDFFDLRGSQLKELPIPEKYDNKKLKDFSKRIIRKIEELEKKDFSKGKIIHRYTGGQGINLGQIIKSSNFFNILENKSSASIKSLRTEVDDEIVKISAKVYDGWRDVLKFELKDKDKQSYLKLFLESLEKSDFEDLEGKLYGKIEQIKIPNWKDKTIYSKVLGEYRQRKDKKESLEEEIQDLENQIDAMVFDLYDPTEDEVKTILDSLDTPEDEKKDILEKFRET